MPDSAHERLPVLIRLTRAMRWGSLPLLAGWLQAWSIAWPLPWPWSDSQPLWWLQLLSLGLFAWQLNRCADWRSAALTGWLYATGWFAVSFWWMFVAMHRYGGMPAPLSALAVLALAVLLALYYAAASALNLSLRLRRPGFSKALGNSLLFAALWLVAELSRGFFFTGFGWSGGGYAHLNGPLAHYAPWLGVYGITFITAWLAMFAAQTLVSRPWSNRGMALKALAVFIALLLVVPMALKTSSPATESTGRIRVALLQGNIPQDEKFEPGSGVPLALRWYGEQLLSAHDADLIVAPETALPLLPQHLPAGYWQTLEARYAQGHQAALVGFPWGNRSEGYTNAAIGLAPGQGLYRYDKHHLVPFGEFIPTGFKWFVHLMNIPLGDFNSGAVNQPSMEWRGQRLAPNICYEDLFGEELGARFADEAKAPTILVNMSNLAWFGDTVAVAQHLNISRMRALEFERPIVRSTNTGTTALIDHQGLVIAALKPYTRGVLEVEVEGRQGLTPYARWVSRLGLWPLWILALAVLLIAFAARKIGNSAEIPRTC